MDYACNKASKTSIKVLNHNQIGGCVTVISYNDGHTIKRIMIDYGEALPGCKSGNLVYPWYTEPISAVFFTHYHADHAGRLSEIPENIPVYMGSVAKEVMFNVHYALSKAGEDKLTHKHITEILNDSSRVKTFNQSEKCYGSINDIPGFVITPYSIDHSAYDAYMFLIETPDTKILHTGDFRGHGRRGKAIIPVINYYVRDKGRRDIDILITEGTMMSRAGEKVITETEMQMEAERLLRKKRYAFLLCSSTNLDSLASFIKAAETVGLRTYCYSNYLYTQLKTFSDTAGNFSDVYKFKDIYVLNPEKELTSTVWDRPHTQEEVMRDKGFLAIIKAEAFCEKYIDEFKDLTPVIIYSMWNGYIDPKNKACNSAWYDFLKRQECKDIEIIHMHTSGHATPEFIAEVIKAVDPKNAIIPIHTENAEAFYNLDIADELKGKIKI